MGMEEDEGYSNDGFEPKSPSAIDYYDINELCEEGDPDSETGNASDTSQSSDDENPAPSNSNFAQTTFATNQTMTIADRPLAGVLPCKYVGVDVKKLFPDYQKGALRFSKIFGIGKESNKPDIWRSVRKKNLEEKLLKSKEPKVPLRECEVESDEEIKFLQHKVCEPKIVEKSPCDKPLRNGWRFGAARLWYDMAEVPETAKTYDYGFKLKEEQSDKNEDVIDDTPNDAFLMLTQQQWEDDVIWDCDGEVREKIMKNAYNVNKPAGWIPISSDRTVSSFLEHCKYMSSQSECSENIRGTLRFKTNLINKRDLTSSLFPPVNAKLVYDRWEDDVIWDPEAMSRISYPKEVEVDMDLVIDIPDDRPPSPETEDPLKVIKDKKIRPSVKKPEEDTEESYTDSIQQNFYNISNDEYYNPKLVQETELKLNCGGSLLQHSIPALELRLPLFPTFMSLLKLRRFHRPFLRTYSRGPLAYVEFHGVECLTTHIKEMEEFRRRELEDSGGGEMFFMRTPEDISGKDGDLVLFEFSEEHPPLMNQVGMASKIRNYYRRKPGKDDSMPEYKYGEIAYAHKSPFLGSLQPGHSLQAYENHLFRAPVYQHKIKESDFLIIRTRHGYYIRDLETVFTVGQELPLIEVPAPKSERLNSFMKDFLMVFIYREFWKSEDVPRKIKMDTVKKAFLNLREFNIRKRLNLCADFQRTGFDSKYWVLKSGFRLPLEEEIRQMVTPEQCCAYYSMLAAEQRLKDAGYGEKFVLQTEDDNDFLQTKIDDEVKAAPWNTTTAFISAIRGKYLLEVFGVADPTGCEEGFSYVKAANKLQWSRDDSNLNPAKRAVRGTDADLRRLSLSNAKNLLSKKFNIPQREIKNMTRWEIIDVVRTLSTEQAKLGDDNDTRFARGNFHSQEEANRRYKEECQRLFDLQNTTLSSVAELTSDEDDSSSDEDEDIEAMGKELESMLNNKKTAREISHEHEERERKELQKFLNSESSNEQAPKSKPEKNETVYDESKILKIYRTYKNSNGTEFVRVETVRKPDVISLYMKIRQSKDPEFIRNFALDETQKEAIRREKRRLQDQLRRLKRNEQKFDYREPSKKRMKIEQSLKVTCGACGAIGHMRTNRACPFFQASPSLPPIQVAMTEEQEEAEEQAALQDQNLIQIDETKIILSKQLVMQADELRRKSLVLKIPKDALSNTRRKKREALEESMADYNTPKGINRKRVDPVVSIGIFFEKLIAELKALPHTKPFWFPVTVKDAPNYFNVISTPMDLFKMKDKIRKQEYKSREEFLVDLQQMLENSKMYNGVGSFLTLTANTMLEHCIKRFSEDEEKLMDLEKAINPLLDSDQVAFSFMLETIVCEQLKAVPESWPFHKPVDKRTTKGYYKMVKNPMDFEALVRNCKANKYKTRASFLADVELILSNSILYNGPASQFTKIAQEIVRACEVALEMYHEQLFRLEQGILQEEAGVDRKSQRSSSPKPKRPVIKPVVQSTSSYNGSVDEDYFVDVECVDAHAKSSSERDFAYTNKDGDSESIRYRTEESNSSFAYSPVPSYDLDGRSNESSNSATKNQSLYQFNGLRKVDNNCTDYPTNGVESYSQVNCDTICDDLMLSESDSDEEEASTDYLKF